MQQSIISIICLIYQFYAMVIWFLTWFFSIYLWRVKATWYPFVQLKFQKFEWNNGISWGVAYKVLQESLRSLTEYRSEFGSVIMPLTNHNQLKFFWIIHSTWPYRIPLLSHVSLSVAFVVAQMALRRDQNPWSYKYGGAPQRSTEKRVCNKYTYRCGWW